MTIFLKNKHTLQVDDFYFKCCIGKNGISNKKKEGDNKTPKGTYGIEHLYYRKSMKRLSQLELQKALGKLMKKRDIVKDEATLNKIDSYITQIKYKLRTY